MGRRKELDIAKSHGSDVLSYQPGKSPGVRVSRWIHRSAFSGSRLDEVSSCSIFSPAGTSS